MELEATNKVFLRGLEKNSKKIRGVGQRNSLIIFGPTKHASFDNL